MSLHYGRDKAADTLDSSDNAARNHGSDGDDAYDDHDDDDDDTNTAIGSACFLLEGRVGPTMKVSSSSPSSLSSLLADRCRPSIVGQRRSSWVVICCRRSSSVAVD